MNKKGSFESEPDFSFIWILLVVVFVLLFGLMFFSIYEGSKTDYRMPNGVICKDKIINHSSILNFGECSDGKVYINPDNYQEIRR